MVQIVEKEKNLEIEGEEIDLSELIQVLIKRKTIIIVSFLIGTILGIITIILLPKVYKKEFIINIKKNLITGVPFVNPNEVLAIFWNIKNQGLLEKILPEHHKMITDIELEILKDIDKLKLTIESTNNERITDIGYQFVSYLNESSVIKDILNIEKEKLMIRYNELNLIIKNYDNDTNGLKRMLREGKASYLGFNPIQFDINILDFKIQKSLIEKNLKDL